MGYEVCRHACPECDDNVSYPELLAKAAKWKSALREIADAPDHLTKSGEDADCLRQVARDALVQAGEEPKRNDAARQAQGRASESADESPGVARRV